MTGESCRNWRNWYLVASFVVAFYGLDGGLASAQVGEPAAAPSPVETAAGGEPSAGADAAPALPAPSEVAEPAPSEPAAVEVAPVAAPVPPEAAQPEPSITVEDPNYAAQPATVSLEEASGAKESLKPPSLFDKGSLRVGVALGYVSSTASDWFILGLGAGYYLVDGLEAGADASFWIGDPFITTLTPGLRYVLHFVPVVKPYVGGYYRHYFTGGGYADTDSVGARAGLYLMTGRTSYFGGGAIYEHFLDTDLFYDQDQIYPEITFAIGF